MFVGKAKLNTVKVLISKTLIDTFTSHCDFFSLYNKLKKHNDMKEETINPQNTVECIV